MNQVLPDRRAKLWSVRRLCNKHILIYIMNMPPQMCFGLSGVCDKESDKHLPGFDEKIWTDHFLHWRNWELVCSIVLRLVKSKGGKIERRCVESINFLFKTTNRKRGKKISAKMHCGGEEKYGNEFKENVKWSVSCKSSFLVISEALSYTIESFPQILSTLH